MHHSNAAQASGSTRICVLFGYLRLGRPKRVDLSRSGYLSGLHALWVAEAIRFGGAYSWVSIMKDGVGIHLWAHLSANLGYKFEALAVVTEG